MWTFNVCVPLADWNSNEVSADTSEMVNESPTLTVEVDKVADDVMVVDDELVTAADIEQDSFPFNSLVVASQSPPEYSKVRVSGWHSDGDEHEVTLLAGSVGVDVPGSVGGVEW